MKQQYKQTAAEQRIDNAIERLWQLFLSGRSSNEAATSGNAKLTALETANSEFAEILGDRRETGKKIRDVIMVVIAIGIDLIISGQAVGILCEMLSIPDYYKYIFPVFLVTAEICLAAKQMQATRDNRSSSFVMNNLQYSILLILIACTLLVIVYSLRSYNASIDGAYWSYVAGIILVQGMLLISALCLHLWVIRNADALADSFAFLRFKRDHTVLTKEIEKHERDATQQTKPTFVAEARRFVADVMQFNRTYPSAQVDFTVVMPVDLQEAINAIMGKQIFFTTSKQEE
jgi:hypothetical protein